METDNRNDSENNLELTPEQEAHLVDEEEADHEEATNFHLDHNIKRSPFPVLGNDMKVSTFWASIDDKFHQNPNVKARIPLRKLKSHWQILNRTCTKFAGCHFRILRQNASGLDKDGKASEFAC
ncbi:hypothetical protein FB192DRAFT_1444001 [Mucor lusitanicus]|uniref:Uncharacterized protein n=1 Tax=Mucor circinelloides f. lusitanicus TaxID=29924 RepID=A0A8H4BMQ8_MUCCL|nr:hypothetical protein FB192DRAFT_1444001 [Mucor lusitanicus]